MSEWPGEEIEYLEETLNEYTHFIENIGRNGLSANLVLHYRTDLQETLTDLEGRAPLESYWQQVVQLDETLREKKNDLLQEIGVNNYRLEREQLDPPKIYWWWFLDAGYRDAGKPNMAQSWWKWLKE